MEQHKILDPYLTSGIVSTRAIQEMNPIQKLKPKTSAYNFKVRDPDLKVGEGVAMAQH